jgi:hypothetical protein
VTAVRPKSTPGAAREGTSNESQCRIQQSAPLEAEATAGALPFSSEHREHNWAQNAAGPVEFMAQDRYSIPVERTAKDVLVNAAVITVKTSLTSVQGGAHVGARHR